MKKLVIALLLILATSSVYAQGWRGYHGARGWGGGSWIVPALIGGAIAYDLARPVYVQPGPVYLSPAPGYAAPVIAAAPQYWYFCAAANGYYPYVAACPGGWQAVPAQRAP